MKRDERGEREQERVRGRREGEGSLLNKREGPTCTLRIAEGPSR